jgi:TPR repeat protein
VLKRILTGFTVVFVVLMLAMLAGVMVAGPFSKGVAADKRGDYAEAVKWYRLAAEQGEAKAQFNLGHMAGHGQGGPQDYAEAAKWFRLAADQGNLKAISSLGFMYASGQGVPQDYAEAAKLYRLAAEQGNAPAQHNLGVMYTNGQGVPQDHVVAHMWFNLAAAQGDEIAVQNRDRAVSKLSPDQIAEAQRLARDWKPTE